MKHHALQIDYGLGLTYVPFRRHADVSIKMRQIGEAAIDQFHRLNRTAMYQGRHQGYPISAPGALTEFIEVLLRRGTITQAADQYNMIEGQQTADTTRAAALRSYAFEVDISPVEVSNPSQISTDPLTAWQVTWQSNDEVNSKSFIAEALHLTNEAKRQRLMQRLSAQTEQMRREQSHRSRQIEEEIRNAIDDYQWRLNDTLFYLSDQASLARVLRIEIGPGTPNSNVKAPPSSPIRLSAMSYLDGYRALDEQITILSAREQVDAFVPGLRDLQQELRALEQDRTVDKFLEALEATPASDAESFVAAHYDLAAIETTYHKKTSLILALSMALGGLLGAIVVVFRHAVNAQPADR